MTDEEILTKYRRIVQLRSEVLTLESDRRLAEIALCNLYKVDECNAQRSALAIDYQRQIDPKLGEIRALESELSL